MSKNKIFILEDDPQFVQQLTFYLKKENYHVEFLDPVQGINETREIIFQNLPNLILCDIRMKPNGFKVLDAIKKDTQLRLIPFIFISAVQSLPDKIKAYLGGADDYITKPIKHEVLVAKIKSVLRRQKDVEAAIYLDPLTQIHNRRYFNKELTRQINLHRRHDEKFSLALLDLDHFKSVNDTYGHQCGDECLVHFTEFMKNQIRNTDIFARWGGEEFVIIMVRSDMDGAVSTLEKILDKLRTEEVVECESHKIQISFSAGVSQYPTNGTDRRSLLQAADLAVYRAKEAGRGKVEIADLNEDTTTG